MKRLPHILAGTMLSVSLVSFPAFAQQAPQLTQQLGECAQLTDTTLRLAWHSRAVLSWRLSNTLDADFCVAALEEANKKLASRMASATAHLAEHPHVAEVRQTGMALAIEMVQDKASKTAYPWQERRGLKVFQHALERGALLRPLGSVVYFLPPYVITPEQIDFLAEVASEGIDIATRTSVSVAQGNANYPGFRDPG